MIMKWFWIPNLWVEVVQIEACVMLRPPRWTLLFALSHYYRHFHTSWCTQKPCTAIYRPCLLKKQMCLSLTSAMSLKLPFLIKCLMILKLTKNLTALFTSQPMLIYPPWYKHTQHLGWKPAENGLNHNRQICTARVGPAGTGKSYLLNGPIGETTLHNFFFHLM